MFQFSYTFYTQAHKEEVINLLPNVWRKEIAESRILFEWKYEQNPFASRPFCFVALHEGKVVGFRGYLVQEFLFKSQKGKVAALADTITHPDYRRMGIFEALTKYSLEEIAKYNDIVCTYNLSASWPPTGGYLKLGWQPIAPRLSLYYFNYPGIIKSIIKKDYKKKAIYTKISSEPIIVNIQERALRLELTNKMYARSVSQLAKKDINIGRPFRNSKTEKYYEWRFKNPSSKFIFAFLWEGSELVSFIAYNAAGKNTLVVVDYLAKLEDDLKMIISKSKDLLKPLVSSVWTISQPIGSMKIFKCCGYKDFNFILNHFKRFKHPPALVRPVKPEVGNKSWLVNGLDLREENNWLLYKIDSDAG